LAKPNRILRFLETKKEYSYK